MARNYSAIPYDYLEEMADLNDAEFGRLIRAVLIYGSTGEMTALCGNERFLFRRAIMQEQRFQSSYAETAERNGQNGKKGGRPRKTSKTEENPKKPTQTEKTQRNPEKPTQTEKTEIETETKTEINTLPSTEGESIGACALDLSDRFAGELLITVNDWLAYKRERNEAYKPTGLKSLLTEIENRVKRHSEQAVADVIRLSMSNGWRSIVWDRIANGNEAPSTANGDESLNDWEKQWLEDVKRFQQEKTTGG